MAPIHGSRAKVYLNGWDISSFLTSAGPSWSADTAEASGLGTTAKKYVPGLGDASLSLGGIWHGGPNELDEILSPLADAPGGAAIVNYLPSGDAFGSRFAGLNGHLTSYSPESPVDDVSTADAEVQSSSAAEFGSILHVLQAEGAGGNSTNIDSLVSSLNGGAGYLQVVSGTALVVTIQHSPDNSVWTDLITFASASARGAQRVATSPGVTVNRHTRALWTGSGTFAAGFSRL